MSAVCKPPKGWSGAVPREAVSGHIRPPTASNPARQVWFRSWRPTITQSRTICKSAGNRVKFRGSFTIPWSSGASVMPPPETPVKGQAVAWLATWVTLVAGGGCCLLIALAMNANWQGLWRTSGPLVGGGILLWWLSRDRQPATRPSDRWSWLRRPIKTRQQVKIARSKPTGQTTVPVAGPPSAESVRELKGGINTWVPSERHREQSRRRQD